MEKTIVAKFDHTVGPWHKKVIEKNTEYRIIAEQGNMIMVRIGKAGFFGWTDKDKF